MRVEYKFINYWGLENRRGDAAKIVVDRTIEEGKSDTDAD